MRMSCNGCRVLRKGCSESCILRPCLEWIKSKESQANAIVFLAKFYGRTGLITLIANGPPYSRPALFRSLLYEACGRLLNPVSGSVGLLWSGNWALCQTGVDSILDGSYPIHMENNSNLVDPSDDPHMQGGIAGELHKVKARGKFKCVGPHNKLKFREHREFIKDLEISSGETQSRGFDIRKTTQDNAIFWTKDVFSSAKGKCSSSSSIASQQPDELDGHNKYKIFHTLNPEVEVFHVKRNEVELELELTLGAQQDNPKLEYTNQSGKALYGLENSC